MTLFRAGRSIGVTRWRPLYREFDKPVGVAGCINEVELAENILRTGDADFVSVAHTLHAAPDWARPLRTGDGDEVAGAVRVRASRATFASRAGREHLVSADGNALVPEASCPRRSSSAQGLRGPETAVQLARRGGAVRVLEREQQIGGQFALACGLKGYPE